MKNFVKLFWVIALVAVISVGAFAQTYEPEANFTVTKTATAVTITKYNGRNAVVNIPPRIQNLPVTAIGNNAFQNNGVITSVIIPDSVISIGDGVFSACTSLKSITIPAKVSIGLNVFGAVTLNSVTFQGTARDFTGTTNLNATFSGQGDLVTKFTAGGAGTYTAAGAVWTKQGAATTSAPALQYEAENYFEVTKSGNNVTITKYNGISAVVNIPPTIQGSPVTAIGDDAFGYSNSANMTSVTIPASVTRIGAYAFGDRKNITSVTFAGTIPSSGFDNDAFYGLGDLRAKFLAGGAGTYTRPNGASTVWTKR